MLKCNPGKTEILHFTSHFSKQPTVYETLSLPTVEMTSKCSKLKWNQGSRVTGFTVKFWSIVVDLFFTTTLTVLMLFMLKFLWKSRAREREQQIAPPSRHFHGLLSYRTKLSTNQRARNRSFIVKTGLLTPVQVISCLPISICIKRKTIRYRLVLVSATNT